MKTKNATFLQHSAIVSFYISKLLNLPKPDRKGQVSALDVTNMAHLELVEPFTVSKNAFFVPDG